MLKRAFLAAPILGLFLSPEAFAGARQSAFKVDSNKGKNFYSGTAAIDGKVETAWMVPGESENKGEWVEIALPHSDLDKLAIIAGNASNEKAWTDYPRLKQIRVDVYSMDDDQNEKQVGSTTLDLADKPGWQILDLPDAKAGDGMFGGRLRLTVLEVYPGEDFPNLAVAEFKAVLKEFDMPTKIGESGTPLDGHDSSMMTDANPKTFFATTAEGASITLGNSGLAEVGFVSAGKDYARPKKVEITCGTVTSTTELADDIKGGTVWADVPAFNGYTGGAFGDPMIKILEVYPGTNPQIGIAELKVKATNADIL